MRARRMREPQHDHGTCDHHDLPDDDQSVDDNYDYVLAGDHDNAGDDDDRVLPECW
ncbi:MAG: hypothetical protein ABSD85_11860 [Acidimicrobiales bacterium]|jgi:hypothetical protein